MSESDNLRKYALECMRLASDCKQLAGDADSSALRSHFLRMTTVWTTRAVRGPNADTQTDNGTKRMYPERARASRQRPATVLH
jgi:hypothetical protein